MRKASLVQTAHGPDESACGKKGPPTSLVILDLSVRAHKASLAARARSSASLR